VSLIRQSQRIVILTGAGISSVPISVLLHSLYLHAGVSCGIPDFRSQNGIYASLKEKGEYELDDPQQMYVLDAIVLSNLL
jgi:NAD-dependent SIR2 family protein deacetylase